MEQKLSEFRARRQAVRDERVAPPGRAGTAHDRDHSGDGGEEASPGGGEARAPAGAPGDWFLHTAVGRWLTSGPSVLSNLALLKLLLWLVLLGLFAELEFGLPFFVVSLFYWLHQGLRGPAARRPGEMSAYSVFNPDCQPLLGSLTAEQLAGEMGYRPLASR